MRLITGGSALKAGKVAQGACGTARAFRAGNVETVERAAAVKLLRSTHAGARLISRHTRELLRRYFKAGKLSTPIADREVDDEFIDLTPEERLIYEAVEDYIS